MANRYRSRLTRSAVEPLTTSRIYVRGLRERERETGTSDVIPINNSETRCNSEVNGVKRSIVSPVTIPPTVHAKSTSCFASSGKTESGIFISLPTLVLKTIETREFRGAGRISIAPTLLARDSSQSTRPIQYDLVEQFLTSTMCRDVPQRHAAASPHTHTHTHTGMCCRALLRGTKEILSSRGERKFPDKRNLRRFNGKIRTRRRRPRFFAPGEQWRRGRRRGGCAIIPYSALPRFTILTRLPRVPLAFCRARWFEKRGKVIRMLSRLCIMYTGCPATHGRHWRMYLLYYLYKFLSKRSNSHLEFSLRNEEFFFKFVITWFILSHNICAIVCLLGSSQFDEICYQNNVTVNVIY